MHKICETHHRIKLRDSEVTVYKTTAARISLLELGRLAYNPQLIRYKHRNAVADYTQTYARSKSHVTGIISAF